VIKQIDDVAELLKKEMVDSGGSIAGGLSDIHLKLSK